MILIASGCSVPRGPVTIVTLGDSITKGVRQGVSADETFSAVLEKNLRAAGIDATVINVGVGGERTDQALTRLDEAVIARNPDLVAVMYGTNDCYVDKNKTESRLAPDAYRANLHTLVDRLRDKGIQVILMTETRYADESRPNGLGEHGNVRLTRYIEICREVARETDTPLVDNFAVWTRHNAAGDSLSGWVTDGIHPNPHGHRIIAETMQPVIVDAIRKR